MKITRAWALLGLMVLAGCSSGPDVALEETTASMEDGATGIAVDAALSVQFVKAVDTATVTARSFFLQAIEASPAAAAKAAGNIALCNSARALPAEISCGTPTVCSLTPADRLDSEASYLLCLTTAIRYADRTPYPGKALLFTTADIVPPAVLSISPADGATGVAVNAGLTVLFSEPVDPMTITAETIGVNSASGAVSGEVALSSDGMTATFVPSAALASFAGYTAFVSGSVRDLAGNAMGADASAAFTTADIIAPSVVAIEPADDADDVERSSAISIVFSEAMDPTTITAEAIGVSSPFGATAGAVSYDEATRTAIFTPSSALFGNVRHEVTISGTIRDINGVALAATPAKSFRTKVAKVTKLASTAYQVAALMEDGTVWMWGWNGNGQLGDGTTTPRTTPTPVTSLSSITDVAAGYYSTIVLRSDGAVFAWGQNTYGQLGDGTTIDRLTPVRVIDESDPTGYMTGVTAIRSSGYVGMALKGTEEIWTFGQGTSGNLGNGASADSSIPVRVHGIDNVGYLTGFLDAQAGYSGGIAIMDDGKRSVVTWGYNYYGQLGINLSGTANNKPYPVRVLGIGGKGYLEQARSVSISGTMGAALMMDGTVATWGSNSYGQLGNNGDTGNRPIPGKVYGLDGIGFLTGVLELGCDNYCAATLDGGSVVGWGSNGFGQLGLGDLNNRMVPNLLPGFGEPTHAIASSENLFVLAPDATTLVGAGTNTFGQLGDEEGSFGGFRLQNLGWGNEFCSPTGGSLHEIALRVSDGAILAAGINTYGQLGDNTKVNREEPVMVLDPIDDVPLTGAEAIGAGMYHNMALKGGKLYSWGRNNEGQLGLGHRTDLSRAVEIPGLVDVIALGVASSHNLAIVNVDPNHPGQGALYAWGDGYYGEMGNGTLQDSNSPIRVCKSLQENCSSTDPFWDDVVAACGGGDHSMALRADGTVWAWGSNSSGQIGDAGACGLKCTIPVQVSSLAGIVAIACPGSSSLALGNDGTMYAWGSNLFGQVGNGTLVNQPTPLAVTGLPPVTAIAASYSGSMAMTVDGNAWIWGYNTYGQAGVLGPVSITTPQLFPFENLQAIGAGFYSSYLLDNHGSIYRLGRNFFATFPDGSVQWQTTPVTVKWR